MIKIKSIIEVAKYYNLDFESLEISVKNNNTIYVADKDRNI
ncbi:hypothetical protein [Clostridium sp.]|nr:hypothetical protein [Clostridium sp.]